MPRRRRRNPWVSTVEVLTWVLFAALLIPVGFAGWAVGHYTSLGKSSGTVTVARTVTVKTPGPTLTTTKVTSPAPPATTKPAATKPAATTTAAAGGDAAAGKALFASNACGSCHTFAPAGSTATIGPDLDSAPERDATKAGMALVPFLHESIVDPNAFVASGYPKGLMPETFGKQLSQSQLADLVAFVASGAK